MQGGDSPNGYQSRLANVKLNFMSFVFLALSSPKRRSVPRAVTPIFGVGEQHRVLVWERKRARRESGKQTLIVHRRV